MDNNSVKNNIVRIRKRKAISQAEMAERLDISRTSYRNIEKGGTKLLSDSLVKIAEILEVSPETILLPENTGFSGSFLEDESVKYSQAVETLKNSYNEEIERLSEEIAHLKEEISSLNEHISTLKELIATKDDIISMLKRLDSKTANR